jgi:NADH:ubiquinone oxidoreductase subunit C
MSQALKDLSDYLVEIKGNLIDRVELAYDELTLIAQPANLIELMTFLRDDAQCQFVSFIDFAASTGRAARTASTWSTTCCRRGRISASGSR